LQSHKRLPAFCFLLGIVSIAATVGCATGGGGTPFLNHSSGNFSNASLKGSYVYQIHGASSASGQPYREVGVFTADGSGNITGGTDDSSVSISANGTAITGSYTVAGDGTGFINLNTSSLGGAISLVITLVSSSKVQLMENDGLLNAVGVAELQDSNATGTTPAGTFVFRLHQEASAQSPSTEEASQVGAFALSSGAGNGAMDQNLNGTFTSPVLTATFNAPNSGRGTASLQDTTASFTTTLVYYIVNSGELALLVSNAAAVGSGSAEAQSGTVSGGLSGSYAFGSSGDDTFSIDGVAAVGQFTANPGTISGTEDTMQDGNYTANAILPSTCFTTGAAGAINGRVVATNGSGTPCTGTVTQIFWMVSPSRAFFIDSNAGQFEGGTADLQTTNSFSASSMKGQFALVMDGLDRTPEQAGLPDQLLSRVGTLQFDGSSKITLNELANASGSGGGGQSPGILSGSYTVSSNGRIVGNLNSNTLNLVMYAVSGSQAYLMQQNGGLVTSGTIELQQ
jgi:hypothetical protein